jgi:subtilase family serine protease
MSFKNHIYLYMTSIIITILPNNSITMTDIIFSAQKSGLNTSIVSSYILDVYSINSNSKAILENWILQYSQNQSISYTYNDHLKKPKIIINDSQFLSPIQLNIIKDVNPNENIRGVSYFNMSQIVSIYNIPPHTNQNVVVGVVSFGGGLYGSLARNGTLTNGDIQAYWSAIGIPIVNHPKVIVVCVDGAKNTPNLYDGGATIENTIDVQIIGSTCKSSKLTIILYLFPYNSTFYRAFLFMYTTYINVSGAIYKPTIISCSWGIPEIYVSNTELNNTNNLLNIMTNNNINICAASGDGGSSDGVFLPGAYVDFPSSSPYVTAVGGTSLICPNYVYNSSTIETAWSYGGGGISSKFAKPSYQTNINTIGRSTPDLASCSDPNTGIVFRINNLYYIIGGTSVASPLIAGFLAAVNFKKFINPIIYKIPNTSFNDILTGTNGAYSCRIGYDNCTGLGSIKANVLYPNLSTIFTTSLTFKQSTLIIKLNTNIQLYLNKIPINTTEQIIWTTNSPNITVTQSGIISANYVGVYIITATTNLTKLTTNCTVNAKL